MNNTLHIYARVSSIIQEEEGTSLDNQKQLGIKKAESLGFSHKLWNEGGQSSNHDDLNNRPVLVSLLAQIEMGNVKHLFVYNTDRLSRNQKTWAVIRYKLLEYGVILYTNSGQLKLANPIDDLMLGILSEISQYDNRIRSERSRLGRFQKIQQGSWKGGPPAFGYRIENKKLVVDQFESEWVKKMFDWYNSGVPVNDIRKRLGTSGVMTRRGNTQWSCGSIHNILYNSIYVGSYDYTDRMIGETVKVSTPPIIDSVTYELAQKRRGAVLVRKKQLSKTKHFYLLRDLLVCGHCGAPMGGRIVKKNHQNVYYCVKSERSWKKRDADHPKWRRGCQCSMVYSVNIKKTDRLVCDIVDWTLRHHCGLKPGFAVTDSHGTASHCHSNSIATAQNQTRFSAVECALGNCAVDSLFIAANDSLQSVRVDNEPFPPHLQGGIFPVYPGARHVQPDTLGGSLVNTMNDVQKRDFLISIISQVRVHYDVEAGCHWLEVEFSGSLGQLAEGFMKQLAVCPWAHPTHSESQRDNESDQTDNYVSPSDRSRLLGDRGIRMNVRFLLRTVFVVTLALGFAVAAFASAQSEYARGVSAFNSLLANEKRAGLRAEWEAVMKPFLRSVGADPKSEYAPRSMFFVGRCYEELARRSFSRTDRLKALEAYERMLAAYPKHGWSDDALFRMGLIWQEQSKDHAKAARVFKTLIDTYPKGDKAPEARERLAGIQGGAPPEPVAEKTKSAEVIPAQVKAAPTKDAETPKKVATPSAKLKDGLTLLGIRHWSSPDYTRVVMDVTQDVHYERALVETAAGGNKQLQITLQQAGIAGDVMPSRSIGDGILSQIQVSPDPAGGALVTFDLMAMDHYRVFTLPDPYRVVIDIYGAGGKPRQTAGSAAPSPSAPATASLPSSPATPADGDMDHVQAALAELQAKHAAEPKKAVAAKPGTKAPAAKASAVQPKPLPRDASKGGKAPTGEDPEITVSNTQKKYTGSLVEQLGLKVRTIMIDAGHGGKDPGAVSNGIQEKSINLRMAKILGGMLKEQGFEVHYTRTGDTFIPLEERTARANAKNADLFISLHCNAYKDNSVRGLEVYYLNLATDAQAVRVAARENGVSAKKISDMQFILSDLMLNSKINESRQMAALVEQETLRAMRPQYALSSHGSKGAFFYVLTGARMPSILVELGYLTNSAEAAKLNTDAYLQAMARGLTSGVVAYKKKLERYALNGSGAS